MSRLPDPPGAVPTASGRTPAARVVVSYGARDIGIEVTNPGGADEPYTREHQDGSGHGLVGMRERVRIFGGSLDVGTQPDGSFRVRATLPLDQATT